MAPGAKIWKQGISPPRVSNAPQLPRGEWAGPRPGVSKPPGVESAGQATFDALVKYNETAGAVFGPALSGKGG